MNSFFKRFTSEEPTFTIILPTHNESALLRWALQSVIAQTYRKFELFVVGDGCTDNSGEVVAEVAGDDPRVHWRPFEKGYSFGYEHRNTALREGTAPLIAYMSHDDLWLPDHLEKIRSCFDDPVTDWAYSRPVFVERDGEVVPMAFNLFDPEIRAGFLAKTNCSIYACCVAHRRSCFDQVGWWDSTLESGADLDLWTRIVGRDDSIRHIDYLPEPTTLRFRAPYKTGREGNPWEMQVWQEFTSRHTDKPHKAWAQKYLLDAGDGVPEQEAIWSAIKRGPNDWMRIFRRKVACQLDHRIRKANQILFERVSIEGSTQPGATKL